MNTFKYYFSTLNKTEKEAYLSMEAGFSAMKSEFSVVKLPSERLSQIHTMIKLDSPLLFNTDSMYMTTSDASGSVKVRPHYTVRKKEYSDTLDIIEKRLSRIMRDCPEGSDEDKELFIHDYLTGNVRYDKLKKQYSHEVTGPLCHGIGVCEGISKAFKLMCDYVGIESICVIGSGVPVEKTTGKKWEMHMWNMVSVGSGWLAVDTTFDNSLSQNGLKRYDYYNVSDKIMSASHSNVMFPVPQARHMGLDYYSKAGRSFEAGDSLLPAVRDAFKKPYISVFRVGLENEDEIKDSIAKALSSDRRSGKFSSFAFARKESGVVMLKLTPKEDQGRE